MPPRRATRATILPTEERARDEAVPNKTPIVNHIVNPGMVEDFGRDKDLKALLRSLQPRNFTGEEGDTPKALEEWVMSMEDYFALAQYNSVAQSLMGRAKLDGSAKLWWKLHCQNMNRTETSMSWEELKHSLKERYLPLNYSTAKMNEFLSCTRKGRGIEVYYEEFVKLSRHAPLMTEEQKLSRFVGRPAG